MSSKSSHNDKFKALEDRIKTYEANTSEEIAKIRADMLVIKNTLDAMKFTMDSLCDVADKHTRALIIFAKWSDSIS